MRKIKDLPNYFLFYSIIVLIMIKIIIFISIKNNFIAINLGGGNDAGYYHGYATGHFDVAVNIWPVILKYFNSIGLYSREAISYLFLFFNLIFIPVICCRLADQKFNYNQKEYLYLFFLCLFYPTLFFFTFDIYRDVFMVFTFLISCIIVKKSLKSNSFIYFFLYFSLSLMAGIFLLQLRPYLGYAFILSLFLWKISFTKKRLIFFGFLYFLILFITNYVGLLSFLTEYRSGFEEIGAGSTLGLDFSNPIMFIPNFILSALGQLFGLYITNPIAIILFLFETVPFIFMLVYIVKNIRLADGFVRFLIIFFVLYGSVWLIGNDNLGTALRLRFYNYFAVYICFFYMLRLKKLSLII